MRSSRTTASLAAGLALSVPLVSCATRRPARVEPVVPPAGSVVNGVASWYGPGYHGKQTASGEVFDQDGLTAAHYNWAFGTRVRVTLISTGGATVVRVNDRFPGHKGRVIDLSRGAARAIGLIGPGTGRVRLEVLGADLPSS